MVGVARDVLKWLQSLRLTASYMNPRRDAANGYLVAEIFSKYYHNDVPMHTFDPGHSLDRRLANWILLDNVC
jgi:hypothetical protein